MTRAAQIERLRGLVAAISKELEVLAGEEPASTPQKSSGLLTPPWWNLLARYRIWRLMRTLRNHRGTLYVPSSDGKGSRERS